MLEGVPVGGGSVCLIQNFGFTDSSVTPTVCHLL